jgi:uncharacterized protein (DUF608 family)
LKRKLSDKNQNTWLKRKLSNKTQNVWSGKYFEEHQEWNQKTFACDQDV